MSHAVARMPFPRTRVWGRRWAQRWNRIGRQTQFYGKTLSSIGTAFAHYKSEMIRLIAQMGLGLFFLSLGARLLPAADVALISQLENVLGPLWVWLAGIEHPAAATIAGGIIVICAVVFQITQGTQRFSRGRTFRLRPPRVLRRRPASP